MSVWFGGHGQAVSLFGLVDMTRLRVCLVWWTWPGCESVWFGGHDQAVSVSFGGHGQAVSLFGLVDMTRL